MFARAGVVWSKPSHHRIGSLSSSPAVWREYVSLSPCRKSLFMRSTLSKRNRFQTTRAYLERSYSSSTNPAAFANPHKVHERWREKQDGRIGTSLESVHTDMIEVLTWKVEKRILDQSGGYLPLTIHSANSQSVAEEQWTDFDAISVMSAADYAGLKPVSVINTEPASQALLSGWEIELMQFKHSISKDKKKFKSFGKVKTIPTAPRKSKLLSVSNKNVFPRNVSDRVFLERGMKSSILESGGSYLPLEETSSLKKSLVSGNLSEQPDNTLQPKISQLGTRDQLQKTLPEKSVWKKSAELSKVVAKSPQEDNIEYLLEPVQAEKGFEQSKIHLSVTENESSIAESLDSVTKLKFPEADVFRESQSSEYFGDSDLHVATDYVDVMPPVGESSVGIFRGPFTAVETEEDLHVGDIPVGGVGPETDPETASVQSAPPVFLSQKKKSRLAKEAKQKKEAKKVAKKVSVKPLDVEKKITYFNQDLLSYAEACVQAGMVSSANLALNFYRYNGTRQKPKTVDGKEKDISHLKIRDINIYNVLMHSWAKQGKLDVIRQCFSHMEADGLAPNMQSYAACLECLARQKDPDVAILEQVVKDVKKDGLDIREMFNQCVFVKDERQMVYQAIQQVLPDYEPYQAQEVMTYDNSLLEALKEVTPEQVIEKNPYHGVLSAAELKTRADLQMELEVANDAKVPSIVRRDEPSEKTLRMRQVLEEIRDDWRTQIKRGLDRKLRYMQRKNKGDHGMNLYPYLRLFDTEDYINLMMKEIQLLCTESEHFSPSSGFLWRRLGYKVHQKSVIHQKVKNKITKKTLNLYKAYSECYSSEELGADNHRHCWQTLSAQATDGPTLDQPEKSWPYHYVKGLGKLLYDIILYDVKFDANILKATDTRRKIPSFYSIYRNYGHTTKEEIKPHPTLVKVFQGAELEDLNFETKELPMLVPPLPWTSAQSGGYLLSSAQLVRLPDQAQGQKLMMSRSSPEQLYPVLDALNTLSACAWKINKPMLDLIVDIFNNKGNKQLDIPPPVSEGPPIPRLNKSMSAEERSRVYVERLKVKQQRAEMYSLWCNELYRLSIANKFRDEIFWFPHNLDFRGRTYPCPPHFNHLGSDVTRSILYFAKGKPLGAKGLDWLKIHLVNLTGFKKRSPTVDRLEFANSLMPSILDSADNPLMGEKWWQTSDEPWQTLACCMEIARAVRSPDHTQYVSHFPVHQDGSCNGLQHYAALGRDQAGAESVNLHPFEEPKDVYSDVALLVERERLKDAAEGLEVAQVLEGFVRRKVIKQTVMTTVYGVTRYGAKYQILRQLKDIPEFPQEFAWSASMYLTEKTFHCLQEMFSATKEIQDWLTVSAHLISTVRGKPVEWVTPLGFPIIQPYHKSTLMNRHGVRVTDTNSLFEKPNTMKQKNAFPPNFIHSLDSTHMMLTAIYCLQAGITYVSVHDCFWTHPCDVEVMNKITREQFVALHQQPILEDLSAYLMEKFGSQPADLNPLPPTEEQSQKFLNSILERVPEKGDFDLDNILQSTYFFS